MKKYKYTVREIMIKTLNDILYPNYTGVNSRDYRIELDKALSMLQEMTKEKWPRLNDKYQYINDRGIISGDEWDNNTLDQFRLKANNVFRTRKEAEKRLDEIMKKK